MINKHLYNIRKEKLKTIYYLDKNPFNENWRKNKNRQQIYTIYSKIFTNKKIIFFSGRIIAFRHIGKVIFVKLLDIEGNIQLYINKAILGSNSYNLFKTLDLGDFIGIKGLIFKTKTGEITIKVYKYKLLSKSLTPLPEKWYGLNDINKIYRYRYLDTIINEQSRKRFFDRSLIIKHIRQFFWKRHFHEVDTPYLQNIPGGAAANPFKTYMKSLGKHYYLRISLELYLKRLLVGGFDRIFEIGKSFRNEGISTKHSPEFTLLEAYSVYADYKYMMQLIYDLIQYLCRYIIKQTYIKREDNRIITLNGKWKIVKYNDLIKQCMKDDHWSKRSIDFKLNKIKTLKFENILKDQDFNNHIELDNIIFKKKIESTLIDPIFIINLPKELCPLAKINTTNNMVLDVFELYINGQEIAPGYSEQNNPFIQTKMFEIQSNYEAHQYDSDFLKSLEYGMPPAGGIGLGIDRLILLLTNAKNIRDTILFPILR